MFSRLKQFKRASAACVALGSLVVSGQALAGGTAPNTSIDNIASVNYSVGGVAQTVIRSAPGAGNSTPGAGGGSNTSFLVDRKIDLYVQEVNGGPTTPVSPGSLNQVTTFFVRNDGNDTQGVNLGAAAVAGTVFTHLGTVTMANVRFFVESTAAATGAACQTPTAPAQPGGMAFTLGTDTAQNIPLFAPDTCTWVYIVSDTPAAALNATWANVELTAIARAPTSLAALTATPGADTAGVDVVFADLNATVTDRDQYAIVTASFTVAKTNTVIDDFLGGANFHPVPGARVEYVLTLTNNGGAAADSVSITDPLPTQTSFFPAAYNGGVSDVSVTMGATTFCIAEAGGADTNADGCFRTTAAGVTTLTVRSPAIASVPVAGQVVVRFRVTIL